MVKLIPNINEEMFPRYLNELKFLWKFSVSKRLNENIAQYGGNGNFNLLYTQSYINAMGTENICGSFNIVICSLPNK